MNFDEYRNYDATGLAELVKSGDVRTDELTAVATVRLEEVNPKINAVIHEFGERIGGQQETDRIGAAFPGIPFLLKNLADGAVEGAPLTLGSRCLRDNRATQDSELVKRYRRTGVSFIGSTNTPELGLMATTEPELYGPTRNPWKLTHSAGGSSGGAAAAVAAGIVPVAHAGDGGGSIRIPASACGVFGLKPTRGRMPCGPMSGEIWNGFGVSHVISRSVRDSGAFLTLTRGPDSGAPYAAIDADAPHATSATSKTRLRIAMCSRSMFGRNTHADCVGALNDAGRLLETMGHVVEDVDLPIDRNALRLAFFTVVAACTAQDLHAMGNHLGRRLRSADVEPGTWFTNQAGHALSAADLEIARGQIGQTTRVLARFHDTFDIIMSPTMAYPPPLLGELLPKPLERAGLALLRAFPMKRILRRVLSDLGADMIEKTPNTMLFNMTGQPAMSVPLHWNAEGLPIGIQFAGPLGSEALLLQLAGQLEEARPWKDKRPLL